MRERDGNRHEHTEPRFHFDSDRGTRLELPEGAGDSGRGGLEDHLDEDFFGMRARERERGRGCKVDEMDVEVVEKE